MRYLFIGIIFTICTANVSAACNQLEKVFDRSSSTISSTYAVFVCSNNGKPDVVYKHWICRTDLSEGDDKEYVYLPPCPNSNYKSEYQQLLEEKENGK